MTLSTGRRSLVAVVLVCAAAVATSAHAGSPTEDDKAAAETLFREAKKLLSAGKLNRACSKFDASHKLDPSVGALLNHAACREKLRQYASAWALFSEAASLAALRSDRRRRRTAVRRMKAGEVGSQAV